MNYHREGIFTGHSVYRRFKIYAEKKKQKVIKVTQS